MSTIEFIFMMQQTILPSTTHNSIAILAMVSISMERVILLWKTLNPIAMAIMV